MLTRFDIFTTEAFVPPVIESSETFGHYFELEGLRAKVSPEHLGAQFTPTDVFTFFVDFGYNAAAGIVGNYLYGLIKEKQASRIKLNGKALSVDKQEIVETLTSSTDEKKDAR
ncbi:MAG: hypothetical protein ACRYG7_39615 [Janthinobacterium lividum]